MFWTTDSPHERHDAFSAPLARSDKCQKTLKKHSLGHSEAGAQKRPASTPWATFRPGALKHSCKRRPGSQFKSPKCSKEFVPPRAHDGRIVLLPGAFWVHGASKMATWAHLFYSVFYSVSRLWREGMLPPSARRTSRASARRIVSFQQRTARARLTGRR